MNKQEAIEKINKLRIDFAQKFNRKSSKNFYWQENVVIVNKQGLIDIINQIDEVE